VESSGKNIVLITAHDAKRIVKSKAVLEPMHVLSYIPSNAPHPLFNMKGKRYALGVTDADQYEGHIRKSHKELREYKNIVEIWNKNFGERGSFIEFIHFILNKVEEKL
jgi:hypothetical protein